MTQPVAWWTGGGVQVADISVVGQGATTQVGLARCGAPIATGLIRRGPYKAHTIARDQAINYFNSIGLNHELFSPVGTDAISFNNIGIPASGLLTGQGLCACGAGP